MCKIKIKYVAQVEIFGEVDENLDGLSPLNEIKYNVKNELTKNIKHYLQSETDEECKVIVTQMFADAWRVEDERTD